MEVKKCTRCSIEKPLSEFGFHKLGLNGYRSTCKECSRQSNKEYREKNKVKEYERIKNYRKNNPDKISLWRKNQKEKKREWYIKWRNNNLEKDKNRKKTYHLSNPEYYKNYSHFRYTNDIIYRLKNNVRGRIYKFLNSKSISKNNTTFNIIGCTPDELKNYIESKFLNGMSWDNRSEWHVDHIIPLSLSKNEEDIYKLCHYTNLQPLWKYDNLSKGSKLI